MTDRAEPRSVAELTRFASDVLIRHGVPEQAAGTASAHMLWADRRGTETHGLVRLPHYVRRIRGGLLDANAEPSLQRCSPGALTVDGGNGLGHPPADLAMDEAVRAARRNGVAAATVRHSGHFGAAGSYAAMAARAGAVGVVMSNAAPLMAPTGGTERRVGNNPLAIAVPFGDSPLVLDIAMSAIAAWSIRLAADRGESIPAEWGFDARGVATTDPAAVLQHGGFLRPMGDHKGYGLALMVDLLTGVLGGGAFGQGVKRLDEDAPVDASHLCLAIDVDAFTTRAVFEERVQELADSVRRTPLAHGATEILLPGEREMRIARQRDEHGIDYPSDILAALRALAEETGIALPPPADTAEHSGSRR